MSPMTLIPATHSRFGWFRSGLLGGAGRGGPLRLVGIVSVIVLAIGAVVFVSTHSDRFLPQSQVVRMKPGNLLPGGLLSTPPAGRDS
jgi:intracellular multiplication protein IcmE